MRNLIILVSLLFLTSNVVAEQKLNPDAEMIKTNIAAFMQKNAIPGVAVLVFHDNQAQSYYFGYANQEQKKVVNKNTIFEIGSLTKLMTSLLLAEQLDQAKAQLDDSITHYMPELNADFEDMTLKNLATHSAGLPFELPANIKNEQALATYLHDWKATYSADEKWQYSNVSMGLLGMVLEKMSKQKIDSLIKFGIEKPLHMQVCTFAVPNKDKKWLATGYDLEGHAVTAEGRGLLPAAGGIKISAEDMRRFLGAALGIPGTPESILYPMRMTQSAYLRLDDKKQGFGWLIHSLASEDIADLLAVEPSKGRTAENIDEMYEIGKYDGAALLDKTGATNGFRAYIALIPDKKSGIVILANKSVLNQDIVKTGREILFKLAEIKFNPAIEEDDEEE